MSAYKKVKWIVPIPISWLCTALRSYKMFSMGQLGEGHMRALCVFFLQLHVNLQLFQNNFFIKENLQVEKVLKFSHT